MEIVTARGQLLACILKEPHARIFLWSCSQNRDESCNPKADDPITWPRVGIHQLWLYYLLFQQILDHCMNDRFNTDYTDFVLVNATLTGSLLLSGPGGLTMCTISDQDSGLGL
ncbi:hypothetical protein VNO77_42026 [Canavalia gladiata]|uniref:Uncharacterized protein n=1 Tax=Canavalia gladiata TaxID=3824 RepID=A0AAN9PS21_CANGL